MSVCFDFTLHFPNLCDICLVKVCSPGAVVVVVANMTNRQMKQQSCPILTKKLNITFFTNLFSKHTSKCWTPTVNEVRLSPRFALVRQIRLLLHLMQCAVFLMWYLSPTKRCGKSRSKPINHQAKR